MTTPDPGAAAPDPSTPPGRAAREALADALAAAPRHGPTLCDGWDVSHLAAHVVLRDSRPDVAVGALLSAALPLARGYVDRQLDATADRTPWPELVDRVRRGPALSPTRVRAVDDAVNTAEFAVHRADVVRATPGWEAAEDTATPPAVQDALWSSVRTGGRLAGRRVPGPLVVATPDGRRAQLRPGTGEPVVVTGEPLELTLWLFGRDTVARVEFSGPVERVAEVRRSRRGV